MLSTLESRSHCLLVVSLVGELVVVLTLVLLSVRAFGHFCGPLFPLLLLSGLGLGACAPASLIVPLVVHAWSSTGLGEAFFVVPPLAGMWETTHQS